MLLLTPLTWLVTIAALVGGSCVYDKWSPPGAAVLGVGCYPSGVVRDGGECTYLKPGHSCTGLRCTGTVWNATSPSCLPVDGPPVLCETSVEAFLPESHQWCRGALVGGIPLSDTTCSCLTMVTESVLIASGLASCCGPTLSHCQQAMRDGRTTSPLATRQQCVAVGLPGTGCPLSSLPQVPAVAVLGPACSPGTIAPVGTECTVYVTSSPCARYSCSATGWNELIPTTCRVDSQGCPFDSLPFPPTVTHVTGVGCSPSRVTSHGASCGLVRVDRICGTATCVDGTWRPMAFPQCLDPTPPPVTEPPPTDSPTAAPSPPPPPTPQPSVLSPSADVDESGGSSVDSELIIGLCGGGALVLAAAIAAFRRRRKGRHQPPPANALPEETPAVTPTKVVSFHEGNASQPSLLVTKLEREPGFGLGFTQTVSGDICISHVEPGTAADRAGALQYLFAPIERINGHVVTSVEDVREIVEGQDTIGIVMSITADTDGGWEVPEKGSTVRLHSLGGLRGYQLNGKTGTVVEVGGAECVVEVPRYGLRPVGYANCAVVSGLSAGEHQSAPEMSGAEEVVSDVKGQQSAADEPPHPIPEATPRSQEGSAGPPSTHHVPNVTHEVPSVAHDTHEVHGVGRGRTVIPPDLPVRVLPPPPRDPTSSRREAPPVPLREGERQTAPLVVAVRRSTGQGPLGLHLTNMRLVDVDAGSPSAAAGAAAYVGHRLLRVGGEAVYSGDQIGPLVEDKEVVCLEFSPSRRAEPSDCSSDTESDKECGASGIAHRSIDTILRVREEPQFTSLSPPTRDWSARPRDTDPDAPSISNLPSIHPSRSAPLTPGGPGGVSVRSSRAAHTPPPLSLMRNM
eukprot:Sspe_Gene.59847::Locus_32916_Transcript_5_10_Confidence_0.268_Length_2993::g.59847::m.59847